MRRSTSTRWPEQIGATAQWERRWRTQTECGKKCPNVRKVAENHRVRETSKQMEPPVFSPFILLSCKLRTLWYIDCSTSVTLRIKPFIWQAGSPYRPGMKAFGLMKGWGLCLKHCTAVTAKVTTNVSVCKTLHTLQSRAFFFGSIWGKRLKCAWFSFQLLCCVIGSKVWCNQCVRGALSVFTFRYCTWKYMNRVWNMCTVEPVLGSKRAR